MELEVLVVPDCPNEAEAIAALQAAARQAGLGEVTVRTTVIDTDEQARGHGFAGSPTFLIDGVDPFAEPGAPIGWPAGSTRPRTARPVLLTLRSSAPR